MSSSDVFCRICARLAVECEIVTLLVQTLLAAGYLLWVDYRDDDDCQPTADVAALHAALMAVR